MAKQKKIRTDLTGRHDVKPEEIIKGLLPPEEPPEQRTITIKSPLITEPKRPKKGK